MTAYKIPFWTVLSVIILIFAILVWMSVIKSTDNRQIEIGYVGLHMLMEQYLRRLLQKTVYLMMKYDKFKAKKGIDIRLSLYQDKLLSDLTDPLTKQLLVFGRGKQIAVDVYEELRDTGLETTDLFRLPDVLIQKSKQPLYTRLLCDASMIVADDSTVFASYSNDRAKEYLLAFVKTVAKKRDDHQVHYDENIQME